MFANKMTINNECVYNLVPDAVSPPVKPPRHKSIHDPLLATTASTFATTNPVGTPVNMAGDLNRKTEQKRTHATFGKRDGAYRSHTDNILKKQSKKRFVPDLNDIKRNNPLLLTAHAHKKEAVLPPVPLRNENPVMGLTTEKNYVIGNAVDIILSSAPKSPEVVRYVNKEDYGMTPEYIQDIKMKTFAMKETQRLMVERENARRASQYMSDEQRTTLLTKLTNTHNEKMKEYQSFSHHAQLNTIGQVKRKEVLEKEIAEIEKSMTTLQKQNIIICE